METLLGIIIGSIFGLAGILWAYFYTKGQMLKIDRMLSLSSTELKEGRYDMDETIEAKIYDRLYRLYRDLELEYKEADMEKKAVEQYIADLSHQIKTPMANLLLYNELLSDGELSADERREFLGRMHGELKKMNWLFSELTNVTRLEGGAITVVCEPLSLWDTLMEAVEKIRVQAREREIGIRVDRADEAAIAKETIVQAGEREIEIMVDRSGEDYTALHSRKWSEEGDYIALHSRKWTVEALVNILENAVKYSKPGDCIKVSIEELELYIRILIKDSGPGILKKDYSKIFQRFYRGENVKDEPGSGLGLYLAQLILNKEEGYITVSSEYGRGSTFSVYLRKGKGGITEMKP